MNQNYCQRCNGLGILRKRYINKTVTCPDCYGGVYGRDSEDVPTSEPGQTDTEHHKKMWHWGNLRAFLGSDEGQEYDLFEGFDDKSPLYDISHEEDDDDNYDLRGPFASLGPYGNL